MADNIDLSTLWVPVVPETSKVAPAMEKAGREAKAAFERGSRGLGDQLGQGLLQGLQGANLPAGMDKLIAGLSSKTGAIAGLVAGGITEGLNLVISGAEKMVAAVTSSVEKAAQEILSVGSAWDEVSTQLRSTTLLSDSAFQKLNQSARDLVASGLDTSMGNLGKTMGVLSSRLGMEAGPALEQLTKHLLELNDRFGDVNVNTFTEALGIFKVSGKDADDVLASLLASARGSGDSLGALISNLGSVGQMLSTAGLSIQQAGALVGEVDKLGLPLTRLSTAEKEFTKMGLSFADGMKLASSALVQLGDTVEGQALAVKLFGARGWSSAMAIVGAYVDVVNAVPGAYDAAGSSVSDFTTKTQSMGNKWTELRQKAEEMLAPFGAAALTGIAGALQHFSDYVTANHDEIVAKIQDFGNKFIDTLPQIKEFAAVAVEIMGQFFQFMKSGLVVIGEQIGIIVWAWAKMFGSDQDANRAQKMIDTLDKLDAMDFGKTANSLADLIRGIDTGPTALNAMKDALDGVANSLKDPIWSQPSGSLGSPTLLPGGGPTSAAGPLAPFSVAGSPGQGFPLPWTLPGGAGGANAGMQVGAISAKNEISGAFGKNIGGGYRPPDGFDEHSSGQAFDVMVGSIAEGDKVAANALQQPGVDYVLWRQRQWNADGTSSGMDDRHNPTANHMDHVHVHTGVSGYPKGGGPSDTGLPVGKGAAAGYAAGSPGRGFPLPWKLSPGGDSGGLGDLNQPFTVPAPKALGADGKPTTPGPAGPNNPFLNPPGGATAPYTPFPDAQYTPLTPYPGVGGAGGMSEDQWYSRQKAIQSATDAAAAAEYRVKQAEDRVTALTTTVDEAGKRKATDQELGDATHALSVARVDAKQRQDELTEAQRKAGEPLTNKKSSTGGGSAGQGFLKGLLSDLGLDDQLFSDPTQWGAFKLLTGGLNYGGGLLRGMGKNPTGMFGAGGAMEGQAWGGLGAGGGGIPGLGMIPGLNIAQAATPTPNAIGPQELSQFPTPGSAVPPNTDVHGAGMGGAPGAQGGTNVIFNAPVTTQDPAQLVPHIQEYANANSRYTQQR